MSTGRIAVMMLAAGVCAAAWGAGALVAAGDRPPTDLRRADAAEIPAPPEEDDMGGGDGDGPAGQDSLSRDTRSAPSRASGGDGDTSASTNAATRSRDGTSSRSGARRDAGVTARQLLVDQRIAQAALRRANAIQARLDGRPAASRDSRDGRASGRVTVSARQMLINQRVAQAALRRVATLEARVDGRPAPRPGAGSGGTVRLTAAQVRINQRIGQAAVRRVNALAARIG